MKFRKISIRNRNFRKFRFLEFYGGAGVCQVYFTYRGCPHTQKVGPTIAKFSDRNAKKSKKVGSTIAKFRNSNPGTFIHTSHAQRQTVQTRKGPCTNSLPLQRSAKEMSGSHNFPEIRVGRPLKKLDNFCIGCAHDWRISYPLVWVGCESPWGSTFLLPFSRAVRGSRMHER